MKQLSILVTAIVLLLAGCASLGDDTSGASGRAGSVFDQTSDIYFGD